MQQEEASQNDVSPGVWDSTPEEGDAPLPVDQPVPGSAAEMKRQLRHAGLLGRETSALYDEWLKRAVARGVSVEEIRKIAREQGIKPAEFELIRDWKVFVDPDGKLFFLVPPGTSSADAREATLLTYILNCGTDYAAADDLVDTDGDGRPDSRSPQNQGGTFNDFTETPYSAAEVVRIAARQDSNWWSYRLGVPLIHSLGGALVTTPNGMLMELGGTGPVSIMSQGGGTTYGDIFMVNIDDPDDPVVTIKSIVESGSAAEVYADGTWSLGNSIDLDRLLHHEERHSQQWARAGFRNFVAGYLAQVVRAGFLPGGKPYDPARIPYERDAGLHDGGYRG